jgi:CheY-like chemotaxis protein
MPDRVEILLVEDNETDAELCIHALKKHHFANNLVWLKDGAEALDFLFGEGEYAGRPIWNKPSLILLDLRMPKVDGIEVLRRVKADEHLKSIPGRADVIHRESRSGRMLPPRCQWLHQQARRVRRVCRRRC